MIDLGKCKPGDTIRIPWASYTLSTGASSAASNYAAADILIYKDGSTTERASTAGFTATTTFDSLTGINLTVIDLADNTTAGFFAAGSEYIVIIGPVTVDSQTVYFPLARFHIGYDGAILDTTIATLASQTSFTLTAGPAEDDALNGSIVVIHDVASAVQHGYGVVLDYTGSTKTVTLAAGTTFTAAAADNVSVFVPANITHVAGTAWASVDLTATMKASVTTAVPTVGATADAVCDELLSGHVVSGSLGDTISNISLLANSIDSATDAIVADLPQRITKNTALAKFPFKMVDSTDHITAKTGLTVTATRSLDGAAFGSCANSPTEIGSGWYYIDLAAGDTNGNTVVLKFTGTAADPREIVLITQPT